MTAWAASGSRDVFAGAGVHAHAIAFVYVQRTSTRTPDSSVAGLVPPPDAASPSTPGEVSATAISTALGTCTPAGRSIHEQHLDLRVRHDP